MNKFADFLDRFLYYRAKNLSYQLAKQKAIAEMLAFGIIKSEDEILHDKEDYDKKRAKICI